MCHKQTFMQRIIAKAIGGIKLSDVQMDEIIKCGAKGGCIMSGMIAYNSKKLEYKVNLVNAIMNI